MLNSFSRFLARLCSRFLTLLVRFRALSCSRAGARQRGNEMVAIGFHSYDQI